MDISLVDGSPQIEIENWSPGAKGRDDVLCSGDRCRQFGWDGVKLGPLWNSRLNLIWKVSHQGEQVRYDGWASANSKSTRIGTLIGNEASPQTGKYAGQTIDPRNPLMPDKYGSNVEGRVRIDGSNTSKLYVPQVVPVPGTASGYYY
jgi:hypothetical protein